MVSVFKFENPREYFRGYIESLPKSGWGEIQKWANHLSLQASYISQVLAEKKQLTIDQALSLSTYLGLNSIEQDYFILMIERDRAGSFETKKYFSEKMKALKQESKNLAKVVLTDGELSELDQSIFYSSWIYSAIRLFCSLGEEKSLPEICDKFSLRREEGLLLMEFLVKSGLCREKNKRYSIGLKKTHLDSKSPYIHRHRMNWHVKAISQCESVKEDELMYSAPFSISPADFEVLREELSFFIQKFVSKVKETDPSELAFINIDLLRLK